LKTSAAGPSSAPEVARGVAEEQVRLLYAQAKGGLLITLLISGLLGALLWETPVRPRVLPWFLAVLVVLLARTGSVVAFGRGLWVGPGLQLWRRVFVVGASAQGALWGICGVLLFPAGHPEQQFFLMVVLSGMAGGAVAYLFPVREAFFLYGFLTLLPPSLRILWEGTPMHVAVGLCGLVFLTGMLFAAHRSHQWLTQALHLGFEKQSLADNLASALAEAAQAGRDYEREVEERVRAEQAQHEAYERYRLVLEASPDPIAVREDSGRVSYLNPAFQQVFGWSPEELSAGETGFVPEPERERTEAAWRSVREGQTVILETRRTARDSRPVEVQVSGAPFRSAEGAWVGEIEIYRDVTRQNQIAQELSAYREQLESLVARRTSELAKATRRLEGEIVERRQAEEALARSEKQYRHLVENIDDVIYASDLKGRITYISPAITALAGYDPAEVIGRRMDEFVHPEDRAATTTAFLSTLTGEKNIIECRILAKSGETRWVRSSGTRIPGEEGWSGVQGVITDLQEVKQAEEHRHALELRLLHAQRMEAMGTLAGGIAHEFRNILQVIRGHGELALFTAAGEDSIRDQMRKLLAAVDRGADLSGKLLTFSRRADGKEQVADLEKLVAVLGGVLERILPRSVAISLAPTTYDLPVSGDPAQIEQVLVNLALNARDAMPQGGNLRISTDAVSVGNGADTEPPDLRPGRYACVTVEDTGHGMDPGTVQRVFDPFFTTKEVGRGTGLGLSIAYGIIRGHGGTITCESTPGTGTRFRVYLPLLAETRAEPAPVQPSSLPAPPCTPGDEVILLVEDERSVRDVTADFLESCGYRVLRASSGEEAVALCRAAGGGIDLVLMDLGMRGMGGQRALEALCQAAPGVPAIVATGYATERSADELAGLGVHRVIAKPYGLSELVQAIHSVLDEAGDAPHPA